MASGFFALLSQGQACRNGGFRAGNDRVKAMMVGYGWIMLCWLWRGEWQ